MTTAPLAHRPRAHRSSTALRALLAACALAALGAARSAGAEDEEPVVRVERPNALRGTAQLLAPEFWAGPADAWAGVTYARQLGRRAAWEITAGGGGPGHDANGAHLGTGLRFTVAGGARSGFTVGVGGYAAFLHEYGTVGFGRLDLAWELRTWSGFDLVLGGGAGMVLTDSRQFEAGEGCWLFCDTVGYRSGSVRPHFLIEIGSAF